MYNHVMSKQSRSVRFVRRGAVSRAWVRGTPPRESRGGYEIDPMS
jgi:hypothetical protein